MCLKMSISLKQYFFYQFINHGFTENRKTSFVYILSMLCLSENPKRTVPLHRKKLPTRRCKTGITWKGGDGLQE